MKRILLTLTLLLCFAFTAVNAQDNYDATTMGNIVRYYETAKWAQGSPFNNQCWTDATQQTHAKTGCVPTAFAIIMRHHGFPAEGIGTLYNQQTGEVFTDRTYDYSKMPLTNASSWTTEQQNEVAKLMAHLGHAFGVTFGSGTTSVSIGNTMSERMQKFFNYNYAPVSNQYAGSGQMYDFEEWKKNLKNSLDNGCPVPYAADNKKDGTNDTRHMFVIDGYTENEYFHFNFGWGGGSNGWYKLDDITPTGDDYSWRTTSDGYDSKHQAFFNLMPNTTTYTVTATVNDSNMGTVSINNGTAGTTATADLMQGVTATLTAHPAQGYALASWTKNGVVVGSRTTLQVPVGTDANDYVANFDDEANVYVIKDYIISPSTVGLTGSSKESVVNYQTSDEYPAALSLASTATNGTSLSAMSRISDDQIRLYAYDQATSSTTVKYTLSVPDGYQITEYKFDYSLNSTSYPCTITYSGGTISPNNTTWTSSPVIVNNAQTAEFTISAENAHSSSNFYIKNFTVTVAKISSEGGTGGSTQTPTTYTIYATAGEGGSVTINDEAVSTKSVNENSTVTLVATPQAGYTFVNWTSGASSVVSTDATYSFTATGNTNLVANFEKTGYTVSVAAGEGGVAYIGTKGTTQATATYNCNVTITAEANDGYRFVEWRAYDSHFSSNAQQDVTVTTDVTYTAVFEAEANEPVEVSGDLEFTFTRDGENATVSVPGAEGVTATITATSPDATNTATTTGIWNTGGEMANSTDVLCTSTNTSRATEGSPITYTLTVNGLRATVTDVAFTHVAVNSGGNLQPSDGTTRYCNFKLEANGNAVGTLSDQNIWIPSGSTDKTIEFNDLSVAADGTLTIKLTIYKGTSNDGCYYGLKKITLTAAEPEQPTDPLAGKYFRLKTTVNSAAKYLNVADNNTHTTGAYGGVNVATLDESSSAQIFYFEASGDGYKLKDKNGYYIKGQEWNVDANSTVAADGSVLLFEETDNINEYYIKWNNTTKGGIRYFKVGLGQNTSNYYPYGDEANKANAAVWVLEEVIPSNEKTLNVTYSGAAWNNEASGWWEYIVTQNTPAVTVKAANGAKAIGYSTVNSVRHPYLLDGNSFTISLPANCKIKGYTLRYKGHNLNTKTFTYTGNNGTTATETVGQDGVEKTLTVTGLNNSEIAISVSDQSSQAGVVIVALEITYIEEEFTPLPFKAEIENWRNDNPNTHLGTITIGGTPLKLTPGHLNASELTMPVVEGTTLAFTRKYRGFEFNGFYIGTTSLGTNPTLTADNVAAINETTPLVAKFTATDDVTLFYDDDQYSYRIPAIAKTGNGMLVAVTDYRHNLDDIGRDNHGTGTKRIDLVMRTSTDNGATWSETKTIAAGDNSKEGSYLRAFGDAAIAAVGQNIVVMAAAGDVVYTAGTTSSPNKMARIYSSDNGATWAIEEMTTKMYSQSTSLIPSGGSAFFGSGKLAVDPNFNGTGNARIYGALLVRIGTDGYNNFGVFSDDLGATWKILGGDNANPVAKGDEPKVEILPNGQILLSARRGGGRVFRVFTYGDDKANGAGSWGDAAVNGCYNGGNNATNGEIICLDAKKPNGKPTKILLQSQPKGGNGQYDRYNVTIWYKEVSADETYTPSSIASGWTQGLEVCPAGVKSAYSAMCLQENSEIAFFFEEAPCYADDHTKGYSMVYVPLIIEEITNNNFLNPNADVEYVPVEFNIELTDAEDNIYRETLDYVPEDVAAALTAKYPFITLGDNGVTTDNKYTNTVTLPFKVSNANTTVWHNIYWPANGTSAGEFYPIYLSSTAKDNSYVVKTTEKVHYGNSRYNTLAYADKLGWAVYSIGNSFTFKFKNKLTGKFMAVNGVVSSGNASNVIYTEEANATAFTLEKYTGGNTSYGNYAIKSIYNGTTGYVCNTSVGHANATNYTGNDHAGAWAKFVEAPDYQAIVDALIADINNFGEGEGKYVADDAISNIDKDALATMPINSLNTQKENVQTVKESYSEITLTIPVANSGSVKIKEEAVSNKFVQKGEVTIEAVPAAGYYFVNWTKPAASETSQASAAARNVEARNAVEVVSTDNPYTFNLTDAVSLEANFEQIVVDVTLTDAQGNTYEVQVSGFTTEITKEAVAEKLREAYPYITLGEKREDEIVDNGKLQIEGISYTYTNNVILPFKVSNTTDIWHDIYWPANGTSSESEYYPIYLMANAEDATLVAKVTETMHYGNSQYNTYNNTEKLAWAVYNVDNAFAFKFKNKLTGKFISVNGVVSSGNADNVIYTDEANATAFTLTINPRTNSKCKGDFALTSVYNGTTGYVCNTSAGHPNATNCTNNNHPGAWVKIVETPDYYSKIMDLRIVLGYFFGAGDGKCVIAGTEIEEINTAIQNNSGSITLNNLTEYAKTMENAMNNNADWHDVALTVAPETGTAIIQLANDDPALTHKRVPTDYELTVVAEHAEGYHFVNWTNGDEEVSTEAEYTFNVTAATTLTANFAINTYAISVLAGEGGSASASAATVEHGNEVTLTAVANDGYRFVNWTKGTDVVSADANYTFIATADGEYVANFELANTPVTYYTVNIETEGLSNDKFAAYINTGTTQNETQKSYQEGSTVSLTAVPDNVDVGSENYLFTGWYIGNDLISPKKDITFTLNGNVTYTAKFEKGCRVTYSCKYIMGYINVFNADGTEDISGTNYVLVKNGTTIQIKGTPNNKDIYQLANWTDGFGGNEVSTDNPYVVTVNSDMELYANFEPRNYLLTVKANDDSYGTVTAESGEFGPDETVKVGIGMTATITATANTGYRFVNWTKGTEVVSTSATYVISAIDDVDAMEDVEYIANFLPVENATAGVYYRIGYDGFSAAASAPATRAATTRAVEEVIAIAPSTGDIATGAKDYEWNYTVDNNPMGLKIVATEYSNNKNKVNAISVTTGNPVLKFSACGVIEGTQETISSTQTTFTLSVNENYVITGYSMTYYPSINSLVTVANEYGYKETPADKTKDYYMQATGLETQTTTFTVTGSSANHAAMILSFSVNIKQVGEVGGGETPETPDTPETPSNRYYVQSKASGVSGKANALLMTQETGASSIFYYADSKLMSYDKGTYLNEVKDMNGIAGARGLQSVNVAGGDVEFSGSKIKVVNGTTSTVYLHANQSGTTYFVDRCGTDNCGTPHNFILENVTSLPVTISSVGYASWYAPVAVELPDGVTAWYLTTDGVNDDYVTMTEITGNIVPANTGVILEGPAGTHNLTITTTDYEIGNNLLTGTVEAKYIDYDAYVLSKPSGKEIGFYLADRNIDATGNKITDEALKNQEGTRFKNNSHKAYLRRTAVSPAMQMSAGFRFRFSGGVTTPIDEMEYENSEVKGIYDLTGRKLEGISGTGIYIVNGKKVLVK